MAFLSSLESSSSESSLRASIAAHESWANTADRSARTANARKALEQKFLDQADGDPIRAEHLKKAHYRRLALKSAQARRRASEAFKAEQELRTFGGDAE